MHDEDEHRAHDADGGDEDFGEDEVACILHECSYFLRDSKFDFRGHSLGGAVAFLYSPAV